MKHCGEAVGVTPPSAGADSDYTQIAPLSTEDCKHDFKRAGFGKSWGTTLCYAEKADRLCAADMEPTRCYRSLATGSRQYRR